MALFGSLLGGALGIGGSIFGGIAASKAMRKAREYTEQQQKDNQNWYDRRYNENATQRASAQRILTHTMDEIHDRNRAAAGAAAVSGASEESVAAEKAANAQAMADAVSQIAVAGEARKDKIEDTYQANKQHYADQLAQYEVNRANGIAKAAQGVAEAGSKLGGAFDGDDFRGKGKYDGDNL